MTMHAVAERPITGRTVLCWLLGFFGVMLVANAVFVWLALASWSGIEVPSAYQASQQYDSEISRSLAQKDRGWAVEGELARASSGDVILSFSAADRAGGALAGVEFRAFLKRPTDSADDRAFSLGEVAEGRYSGSLADVAPGQWDLVLEAFQGGDRVYRSVSREFLPAAGAAQ